MDTVVREWMNERDSHLCGDTVDVGVVYPIIVLGDKDWRLSDSGGLLIDHCVLGTLDNPIVVRSFGDEQFAGCTGYPADSHWVKWLKVRFSFSFSGSHLCCLIRIVILCGILMCFRSVGLFNLLDIVSLRCFLHSNRLNHIITTMKRVIANPSI